MRKRYTVTIDGPAGSGKSTAARLLAQRLGIVYLNSGALYRAATYKALELGLDPNDDAGVVRMIEGMEIVLSGEHGKTRVMVDGKDVTAEVNSSRVTEQVWRLADNPVVREAVGRLARRMVQEQSFVAEGRDQGTVVFPEAEVKFYLDASLAERARRRHTDLTGAGEKVSLSEVESALAERDRRDMSRKVGTLKQADDAIYVDNSKLDIKGTVELLSRKVMEKLGSDC